MFLRLGVYTAYWLRLAMCCSPCWRYVQFESLMGSMWWGALGLSERRWQRYVSGLWLLPYVCFTHGTTQTLKD